MIMSIIMYVFFALLMEYHEHMKIAPSGVPFLMSIILGVLLILGIGASGYGYYHFSRELASTRAAYQEQLTARDTMLASTTAELTSLKQNLTTEQQKNASYGQQVDTITSTVADLSKLATLDPQLLAKYSKVYFLNENYVPARLATVTPEFVYDKGRTYQFEADALPFLNHLLQDAAAADTGLEVVSAYRSFGTQAALKSSYKVTYGAGTANSFSADQGYSEHQLGTALDFTTSTLGANFASFDKTSAYQWLMDNAYKYGFILSYPKGNAYYTYEPWHWRFVGVKLANMLHTEHENFYDLDQRTITPYLITLFDPQ